MNNSLENLKLRKVLINNIEVVKEHISSIEIYESLMQPGITGFINLMDYQAIAELGLIFAGDEIILEFTTEANDKKIISQKFSLYSSEGNKLLPQHSYNALKLGFCSPWLIDALTKKISKNYTDKYIHEIIKDLIEESGGQVGYIEPTLQKLENFVTPLWTPYHSIKHLLSFTLSKNNNSGYLCWTDLDTGKVNVTSLNYLTSGTLGKFKSFVVNASNIRYEGTITDCTFETNYDLIRLVNNGLPRTNLYGFNFNKGKEVKTDKKLEDIVQTHLSKKFPLPSKYQSENYYTNKFTSIFPNNKDTIANNDDLLNNLLDGQVLNDYSLISSDVFKINLAVPGEPNRRVGWLAEVDYPSQNINSGDKQGDKRLKGDYLIRDIKHTFSFYIEYKQSITLVSDGYKEFNRDIINWIK